MTSGRSALNVLCVDDSPQDVELIIAALRQGGRSVTFERVENATALEAALDRGGWDIVISDYSLPQFDGLAALHAVKRRGLDIPFIIVSGAILEEIAVTAMKTGAHDYVMKHELARLGPAVDREMAEAGQRRARRLAEANLRSSEALLNSIINAAADAILVIDESGTVEFVNAAVERLFGWKPLELIGKSMDVLLLSDRRGNNARALTRPDLGMGIGSGMTGCTRELDAKRKNGGAFSLEATTSEMRSGGRVRYTCILRDITERKRTEERIRHLAHYDELTGLPNRTLLLRLLDQALAEAKFANTEAALLCIDLDRFKLINDTLNHEAGDAVLRQVAQRLAAAVTERDTAARFGGDEFVLLMRNCRVPADPERVAKSLLEALARPFTIEDQEYHLTASIGISTFPSDGERGHIMLKNADAAMTRAKEHGKNNYQFYSAQMNVHSLERLALDRFLRHALEQNEFELYYQPKIDLSSGRITGMEALLRWMHPTLGMIAPVKFIPLAEETGLIVPIGAWVLKSACAQVSAWRRQGWNDLRVAVNISARQFARDDLYATVVRALDESALAPDGLELEITESLTMDNPEHAAVVLAQLKSLGIKIALDDFGTGYSSLGYLKRFPIDNVKIDRSFIKDTPGDADDAAITRAVIAMAHSLRLKVIAEGVESKCQVEFLREFDCDEAQGYLFGKPMPAREFAQLLQQRRQEENEVSLCAEPV